MTVDPDSMTGATPIPQPQCTLTGRRRMTLGLPKCDAGSEHRFPLTPEAVQSLTDRGFTVVIEEGAAACIHYTDEAYTRAGAHITDRGRTLECDIVIHLTPLAVCDIRRLRRGAMLLTLSNFNRPQAAEVVRSLLERHVLNIAIDLITDDRGNHPFADILAEISGRAAMVMATSMLADPVHNKGILIGGIAGVIPCEVVVLGSDISAIAAARSALGLGATVRMFDGDVYRLRRAVRDLNGGVIGSSIHPHALENALRTADIVISTDLQGCPVVVEQSGEEIMKKGVLIFDLSPEPGKVFPSMPQIDLAAVKSGEIPTGESSYYSRRPQRRVCFVNASGTVPRTAAMALSDTFITMLDGIAGDEASSRMINLTPGLQGAALTFLGRVVNERVARLVHLRYTDIRILLTLS